MDDFKGASASLCTMGMNWLEHDNKAGPNTGEQCHEAFSLERITKIFLFLSIWACCSAHITSFFLLQFWTSKNANYTVYTTPLFVNKLYAG